MVRKETPQGGQGFYGIDRSITGAGVIDWSYQQRPATIEQALAKAAKPITWMVGGAKLGDLRDVFRDESIYSTVHTDQHGVRVMQVHDGEGRLPMTQRQSVARTVPDLEGALVDAYTAIQRDEQRTYRVDRELRDHFADAWSMQLRAKVQASDDKRREADRLQVVIDNSWYDD